MLPRSQAYSNKTGATRRGNMEYHISLKENKMLQILSLLQALKSKEGSDKENKWLLIKL